MIKSLHPDPRDGASFRSRRSVVIIKKEILIQAPSHEKARRL